MKIGFFAIGIGHLSQPDLVKTVAVNAERLNFATVWAPEHVVLLDKHISKYPYSKGEFPLPTDTRVRRSVRHARLRRGLYHARQAGHRDLPGARA